VEQANLPQRRVRAEAVVAMSSSTADGPRRPSTRGFDLIGLSINGSAPVDVTPPPNTTSDPGGAVILNEQIFEGTACTRAPSP